MSTRGAGSRAQETRAALRDEDKYDLEAMLKTVAEERAYDESVKIRVTQDDIRKLIQKKRKRRK